MLFKSIYYSILYKFLFFKKLSFLRINYTETNRHNCNCIYLWYYSNTGYLSSCLSLHFNKNVQVFHVRFIYLRIPNFKCLHYVYLSNDI